MVYFYLFFDNFMKNNRNENLPMNTLTITKLSMILFAALLLQACGPVINFTPLTKDQVDKITKDDGYWGDEAKNILTTFLFGQVDVKPVAEFMISFFLTLISGKDERDKITKVEEKLAKKSNVQLLDPFNQQDKQNFVDNLNTTFVTPLEFYQSSLFNIASTGASMRKVNFNDELEKVFAKAGIKKIEKSHVESDNIIAKLATEIIEKLQTAN